VLGQAREGEIFHMSFSISHFSLVSIDAGYPAMTNEKWKMTYGKSPKTSATHTSHRKSPVPDIRR
jgi:hypothetical protein